MTKKLSGNIKYRVKHKKDYLTFLQKGLTWKYIQPKSALLARKQA